ncbi:MAG: hypothetical protein M3Q46_05355 [Verrucomicrobiota bacterium]|nr:hypothetical protein [Verrucomicrobiota bacterium]
MMNNNFRSNERGSVLIWTVLTMLILSLLGAEVLRAVSGRYQLGIQSAKWQESLIAAESGVDLAVVELRKSLYPAPNGAWSGWDNTPGNGVIGHGLTTVPTEGLAATPMSIEVAVDAPAQLVDPSNGWQYYRIRTLGSVPLPGAPRVGFNKGDNRLRKLTLRTQRSVDNLFASETTDPHAARRIEAVVKPVSSFNMAILAIGNLDLNNQNIRIDSYDSRDDAKSTLGLYDAAKFQQNGNIATDGSVLEAGGAQVYGSVSTNNGTATGVQNVTGEQRTDFYQDPIPIGAPTWSSINPTPFTVNGNATISASSTEGSASSRYLLSAIKLDNKTLTLAGNADGSPSYIEIHVTGDIDVKGSGQIILGDGVKATIYFDQNLDIAGNGILNPQSQPSNLLLYGVQPDPNENYHANLGGNGTITAALYAPGHAVKVNGGGTNGHVFGSVVGKTVTMTGVTNLHYDEALSSGGLINNYQIVSWVEDTR